MQAKRYLFNVLPHKGQMLVTLNQPKSNLCAGISDTLKRELSESVIVSQDKTPRANPSRSSPFPIAYHKKSHPVGWHRGDTIGNYPNSIYLVGNSVGFIIKL